MPADPVETDGLLTWENFGEPHPKIIEGGFPSQLNIDQLMKNDECHVVIEFGSYATGISLPHAANVKTWLLNSPDVESIYRIYWGKEGEVSFCAKVSDISRRQKVIHGLNLMVLNTGPVLNGSVSKARAN